MNRIAFSGNPMRGKPVFLTSKQVFKLGEERNQAWGPYFAELYYDISGYENGTSTYVSFTIFWRQFHFRIHRFNPDFS